MRSKIRNKSKFSACGLATVLLGASLTLAKSYDIVCDTQSFAADAVDRTVAARPDSRDMHQEDLAQVNLVLASDGNVVDKT